MCICFLYALTWQVRNQVFDAFVLLCGRHLQKEGRTGDTNPPIFNKSTIC